MNNIHDINRFIEEVFSKSKVLKSSINAFLFNPEKTILFNEAFVSNVAVPIHFQSLNSIKKRKKGEYGDISDVWTFYLNPELKECEFDDYKYRKFLKKGNRLHICRVWINWFLEVYYVETTYVKKSNSVYETGFLAIENDFERTQFNIIIDILEKHNQIALDFPYLATKVKNVSTDIESKPTLFQCLFSDIIMPTKSERRIRKKINSIEIILQENLDQNNQVIDKSLLLGGNNYNCARIDFDSQNKFVKVLSHNDLVKEEKNT